MQDIHELTLIEAGAAIRERRITAADYVRALLDLSQQLSDLNAFIFQNADQMLSAAIGIDQRIANGDAVGILAGIPIGVKDNIETAGVSTTAGTETLRNYVPSTNARVVQALLAADAILGGKTNLYEVALAPSGVNPTYGSVGNPYDSSKTSGGSSAGTGAAVAGRMLPAGLGTDTGGSCRIPAALCGCVGFRPTVGRYPQDGIIMISATRDTVGILGRTTEDITLLDSICANDMPARSNVSLDKVSIGVPRNPFYLDLAPDLSAVVESALDLIRSAGVRLIERPMPTIRALDFAVGPILPYEAPREVAAFLSRSGVGMTVDEFAGSIQDGSLQFFLNNPVDHQTYLTALTLHRPALQSAYDAYFTDNGIIALIIPTTVAAAPSIDRSPSAVNTNPASNAGLPCLSIPVGVTAVEHLPVGLEFVGPSGSDSQLLGLGRSLESVLRPLSPPQVK